MDIDSAWRRIRRAIAAAAVAGMLLPLGGCVLLASWPSVGNDTAVNDPNFSPMPKIIVTSVREVIRRYPMPGEFVVNLPEGLERTRAERMIAEIGPGARLVDAETEGLPVFHVTKVWVRGDRAEVDVIRPLDEPQTWQRVTVHLQFKYSIDGWRVQTVKVWPMGMATPGSLYGWLTTGAAGDPPEYTPGQPAPPPADEAEQLDTMEGNPDEVELRQTIDVKEGEGDGSGQ